MKMLLNENVTESHAYLWLYKRYVSKELYNGKKKNIKQRHKFHGSSSPRMLQNLPLPLYKTFLFHSQIIQKFSHAYL